VPSPQQKLVQKPAGTRHPTVKGSRPKTLAEELLAEAREVALSRSGKHKMPAQQQKSWITRLFGAPKR